MISIVTRPGNAWRGMFAADVLHVLRAASAGSQVPLSPCRRPHPVDGIGVIIASHDAPASMLAERERACGGPELWHGFRVPGIDMIYLADFSMIPDFSNSTITYI